MDIVYLSVEDMILVQFEITNENFLMKRGKISNFSLEVMILKNRLPSVLLPWLLCTTDCHEEEGLMPYLSVTVPKLWSFKL